MDESPKPKECAFEKAMAIYKNISPGERMMWSGHMVFIVPFADSEKGTPYAFGWDHTVLGKVSERFGPGLEVVPLFMDARHTGILPRRIARRRLPNSSAVLSA